MADFLRGSAVPLEGSGPTLDEQIDHLASFGVDLHPDLDRAVLRRAVARGVTPEDLGAGGSGARSIPPHRRACFWWLLCEEVGGVPSLEHRLRIDLGEHAFNAGYVDEDMMPLPEQLAMIRRIAHRLRGAVAGVQPVHLAPLVDDDSTCLVRLGTSRADWSRKTLRARLREVLGTILPEGQRLVMYRDLVEEAPDLCLVVPSAHESAVRALIVEVLPPALRAGGDWLERVEHHSTAEQVPFTLDPSHMTSGVAVGSVDVPAWTGVHPPMVLADQLEDFRRVGLVPWTVDVTTELPVRRPSRVPRMCDRPYHDLLATPGGLAHRGLLRGVVHLPERIPDEGRPARVAAVLTRCLRAVAEVGRPGLAIPRVRIRPVGEAFLEVTASIDGAEVTAPVRRSGGRSPFWDVHDFLELAAAELRDQAQRWVVLRPGSRAMPAIVALVALWQADEVLEMARIAFGDVGRHHAAATQEHTWGEWADRTSAHDLMFSMTPSGRLAALEGCGISLADADDRDLAERAAQSSTWVGLLDAAHHDHRSVFEHVCVWSAREIADQRIEGLPGLARKVARSVGRDDVELQIVGAEDMSAGKLVLQVGDEVVELMDHLPAPEEICHLVGDIAVQVTPPGRGLVTLGDIRLWPLESRAGELQMLLSGG